MRDTCYRVWPDGTVQNCEDEEPYNWLSDDYQLVSADDENQAREIAEQRGNNA
jgi:hypothetical protein